MTKVNVPCAKIVPFCGHHVVSYTDSIFKLGAILVVLRVYLTLPIRLHRIFESMLQKMDFVKFRDAFQSKMPMIYGRKQSILRELCHISTILACVMLCR